MKRAVPYFAALYLISMYSCKKPTSFTYRDIKNIKMESLGFATSKVSMDLVYFNPNNFSVNLKTVKCDLYIDSNFLGTFVLDTLMHIPKASEFTLPASLQVNMKELLKSSLNIFLNPEVTIGAKGTTKVGKGGFYVTIPFNYEGRQKINLF